MSVQHLIFKILENLDEEEFNKFKWFLQCPDILDSISIPKSHLDKANRWETVNRIVEKHNQQCVEVVKSTLQRIPRNDLVEIFSRTLGEAQVFYPDMTPQPTLPQPTSRKMRPQSSVTLEAYSVFISKSTSLREGSPALYQLRPKKEQIGSLTKKTVGEQNLNKVNKTILLVGERGTGKSTLINALVNYAMGVKFEDDIWFEIVEDEKRSWSESQTSNVVVYEIFDLKENTLPFSLTIIDTPGFGDTRGFEHDLIVSQRLLDLFSSRDGVHEISTVGLVMKASENRMSGRLMYIFDSVTSLFGNNLADNIVTLITHSDGLTPENALKALDSAEIKCAKNLKNHPVHFLFDNCQATHRTQRNKLTLKKAWEITRGEIDQFIKFLEERAPQQVARTVDALKSRVTLKTCIQKLKEKIQLIEQKQTKITQIQEALNEHEQEMKKNENFISEVDEYYKEKEQIDGGSRWLIFNEGAVCCQTCETTCHYPCTIARSPAGCDMMKGGRCTRCKCPVVDHVKDNWRFVSKTRKVEKVNEEMKEKYEENKAEIERKSNDLQNLKKEVKDLETEIQTQCLDESYQHLVKLDQIALNVNSLSTHVHLDFLTKMMKERKSKGNTEKIQKLEEMKSRVDERTRAGLQYMFSKLTAGGKSSSE